MLLRHEEDWSLLGTLQKVGAMITWASEAVQQRIYLIVTLIKIEHIGNINPIVYFFLPRFQERFTLEEIFFLIFSLAKGL